MKKRILIPITGQGAMVYIVRSGILKEISKDIQPIILLYWQDEGIKKELEDNGYEVYEMKMIQLSNYYKNLYYKINLWYLTHVLKFNGIKFERKLNEKYQSQAGRLIKNIRYIYNLILFKLFPFYIKKLLKNEAIQIKKETGYLEYSKWLKNLRADGLFTNTPFVLEINLLARILKSENRPIIASIHSFDNVTKRGWQPTIFDKYLVWNKYNKQELLTIFKSLNSEDVFITGAPQFDFHYQPNYVIPKIDWLKQLGIPQNKKVVLYAGGSVTLFPTEPQYAKHLIDNIHNGTISKDVVILVRKHPLDKVDRWKEFIGESENIVYYDTQHGITKLDYSDVTDHDIQMLVSTLQHCDVHINLCSTMTVDGSVFEKPQIGPYYDEINVLGEPALRAMYAQEHYKPILRSNVIHFAKSKSELINLVNTALISPNEFSKNCKTCVEEIITFADGNAKSRVSEKIKTFFCNENTARC
jgi:hypothetical protein